MTRKNAREIVVRLCFGLTASNIDAETMLGRVFDEEYYETLSEEDGIFSEYPDEVQLKYIYHVVRGIWEHSAELDSYVAKYAKGWQFSRISRTALAVMKTAMFEIMYMPDIPDAAAINEAVEIAKSYEDPDVVSFINGILGAFVRKEVPEVLSSPASREE